MNVDDAITVLALIVVLSVVLAIGCLIEKIADHYERRDRTRRTLRLVRTYPPRWDDDLEQRLAQLSELRESIADRPHGGAA